MVDDINDPLAGQSTADPLTGEPIAPIAPPQPVDETAAINVRNPEGHIVSIPKHQAEDAYNAGFQPVTDAETLADYNNDKYGTAGQQLVTGLEGAAKAATFGLSSGIEKAYGVKPEDIAQREEINPGAGFLGQTTGLVGSMLTGEGEGALLSKLGEAGAEAVGLGAPATLTAKIGSGAVKAAIENAGVSAGDENSKLILGDPNQSVASAAANIGLSGLIGAPFGAGIGALNPLWEAASKSKLGQTLAGIQDRLGGVEGQTPDPMGKLLDTAGVTDLEPQQRAALSNNPTARQASIDLLDSGTGSGTEHTEAMTRLNNKFKDVAAEALGKSPEDLENLKNVSAKSTGEDIGQTISDGIEKQYAPVKEAYEEVSRKFKGAELDQGDQMKLNEDLAKLRDAGVSPEAPESKLLDRVMREAPGLKNLEQMRNYISSLNNETSGIAQQPLWRIGRAIKGAFGDAESSILDKNVLATGDADLFQKHLDAKAGYKAVMDKINTIDSRLNVPKWNGPGTFIKNLRDMDGETVLGRLNPKNKASIISELHANFPEVAGKVQDYHLGQLTKSSLGSDGKINVTKLSNNIDKLSPEVRSFAIPHGASEQIGALRQILQSAPSKIGKSGTSKALDSMWSKGLSSTMGAVSAITGHNPIMGSIIGHIGKLLGRDVPDAAKLGLLKFLGSDAPVNPSAFKSAVDYIHTAIKGESMINSGVKAVFKAGREVLPQSVIPSQSDRDKLDKQLKSIQKDPGQMNKVGGQVVHYMPDHGQQLSSVAAGAVSYVNSQRPVTARSAPLDSPNKPSSIENAKFQNILNIALSPQTVISKIPSGRITPADTQALQAMYPALYNKYQQKLTNEMIEHTSKGNSVPYTTKLGLSMFMGQPLDSTMTAAGIVGAQPKQPQQSPQSQPGKPPAASSVKGLAKLPNDYKTATQAREQSQLKT